jgi:polyisoprenoid-binding protein YceI
MNSPQVVPTGSEPALEPEHAIAYAIDPGHASASFKVRHLLVSHVRGELGEVTGEVLLDTRDATRSSVSARIDASGISTRNAERDAHLRSADFLDVATHPAITFRSTRVRALQPGRLAVEGSLAIRGTTLPVTLDVELSAEVRDPWGNAKRGVLATIAIDRRAFGVSWNAVMGDGGLVVGERVDVTIEAELVRLR